VIDGNKLEGVLHIRNAGTVLLRALDITNGKITPGTGDGGGILNDSNLTVDRCTIHHNIAYIYGGGIQNTGTLTVTDSILEANDALDGGGISNAGTASIVRTSIIENLTGAGAIYTTGQTTLTSTTVSSNFGGSYGGGIYVQGGTTIISSSTIVSNTGGGMSGINVVGGTLRMRNSVVSDNAVADCYGTIVSLGGNFVGGPYPSCSITSGTGSSGGDQVGTYVAPISPELGPLQNNGGVSRTQPSHPR
jgi:hypothetical protein